MYLYLIIIYLLHDVMTFQELLTTEKMIENLIQIGLGLGTKEKIPDEMKAKIEEIAKILNLEIPSLTAEVKFGFLNDKLQDRQERVNTLAANILSHYTILKIGINSSIQFEAETLRDLAMKSTRLGDNNILHDLNEFFELIIPTEHPDRPPVFGFLDMYSNYVHIKEEQHRWCDNEQSANHFIYKSLKFIFDILSKGYWILLQSYEIRKIFDKANDFAAEINYFEEKFKKAITAVLARTNNLMTDASTRIHRCDPPKQIRGETYLELEKLLQGIVLNEMVMNPDHTLKKYCAGYHEVSYYPYENVRGDGDFKCYGLMYNCFRSYLDKLCKPATPNRRFDGFIAENSKYGQPGENASVNMGNLTNCYNAECWDVSELREIGWTPWLIEECACICDDYQHPKTLRSFSIEYVFSDYRNNMVMTGIRLMNISNVIHFDIQQGKLEKFGFINPSKVHWRPRSEIENENVASPWKPIVLNYWKRGVYLDTIHVESSEAIIGVRFQWDSHEENVVLAVLVAEVDFPNGQVLPMTSRWRSKNRLEGEIRTEVILDKPHMPTLCTRNIPTREENKFIQFQTTDWVKDAAQSTIPYLDIQAVVTNPPSLIGGIGLNYKNASGCGGYIAVELYSFNYSEWINRIPIPSIDIEMDIDFE